MTFLVEVLMGMLIAISPMLDWPIQFDQRDITNWTEVEWSDYMRFHTAVQSHERLKRGLLGKTFEGHTPGHEFGHALYEVFRERGMPVCDSSYYGGCLHEYNARMVLAEGPESVMRAVEICEEVWRDRDPSNLQNCQHGIGHAFLMFFGYSEEGLQQALDKCLRDVYRGVADGRAKECYDGAFMDFNQENITHQSLFSHRSFDPSDPYHPCDDVDDEFKQSCYYRLTRLWALANPDENIIDHFTTVGNWCRHMPDQFALESCRLGINSTIVTYRNAQNWDEASGACHAAYTEPDGLTQCLERVKESLKTENRELN